MQFDFKKLTKEYKEAYPYVKPVGEKKYNNENYIKWNNTILEIWEYEMLLGIGAINKDGIICDYPILSITDKNGKETTQDFNGDLQLIKNKAEEIKSKGLLSSAKILFCPHKYSLWINQKKSLEENISSSKFAKEINTPPVSSYRDFGKNIMDNINF